MVIQTVKNRPWLYVLLILPVIIVLGIYLPLANRLPGMTATHWSSTYPDGFTRTGVLVPVSIGLSIAGAIIGLSSLAQRSKPALLLALLFIGSLLSWTTAGVFIGSVVPTALAETPQTAVIGIWMLPMAACTLVSLVPLWICGVYQSYSKQVQEERQARINRGQGLASPAPRGTQGADDTEFSETMKAPWWLWALGIVVAATGAFLLLEISMRPGAMDWTAAMIGLATCLVITPLTFGLCLIRVTITEQRIRVASAIFGFPLRTIKPGEIQSVTSTEIDPMAWGGWGWRFFPGGSAVVLRRHEGLAFELKNSSRFAVTVPNSQRGAEQLNARMQQNGSC